MRNDIDYRIMKSDRNEAGIIGIAGNCQYTLALQVAGIMQVAQLMHDNEFCLGV